VPVLRALFTNNDKRIEQSDIVMLLTPRIVRTQEITADDLRPINVGTSQNMGLGGQGAVFGNRPTSTTVGEAPAPLDRRIPGAPAGGVPTQPAAAAPGAPQGPPLPPVDAVGRPIQDLPPAPGQPGTVVAQPAPVAATVPAEPAAPADVIVSAPGMTPGEPASVPISITNASRLTQVTMTITYDPALMRAVSVQPGQFMAQGGVQPAFQPSIDEQSGRIDIVIVRNGDESGASGTGLLASIQFQPLRAGSGSLTVSGSAASPEGQPLPVQFAPAPFTIR
jgi:hypothetical protein